MVDGKLPDPVKIAVAHGELTGLFRNDDYPADAVMANQAGGTKAMLMIDETGKVVDCVPTASSGSAAIDAIVCQVFTERAKFTPATDASGKASKSVVMAPEVRFVIAK
jgi:outer membrane biosynthesis protein TonB